MAGNTGNNSRNGAIAKRTQVYNPINKCYIKRNSITGKFISVRKEKGPYKGVTDEKKKKEKKKLSNKSNTDEGKGKKKKKKKSSNKSITDDEKKKSSNKIIPMKKRKN